MLLPKPAFDCFLKWLGKDWAAGDYMFLLSLPEIESLLAEAEITNYTVHKNRFLGFPMDFSIIMKF